MDACTAPALSYTEHNQLLSRVFPADGDGARARERAKKAYPDSEQDCTVLYDAAGIIMSISACLAARWR